MYNKPKREVGAFLQVLAHMTDSHNTIDGFSNIRCYPLSKPRIVYMLNSSRGVIVHANYPVLVPR